MVARYWSADSFFWKLSINHNTDAKVEDVAMVKVLLSPKFQPLKCPLSRRNLSPKRSDFGRRNWKTVETVLAARSCLCDVILSNSKLAGRRKTCKWLCILHKDNKIDLLQTIIYFSVFNVIIFIVLGHVWLIVIYMKNLLGSDWLRTVQFFLNTVQKRGNWMQKR